MWNSVVSAKSCPACPDWHLHGYIAQLFIRRYNAKCVSTYAAADAPFVRQYCPCCRKVSVVLHRPSLMNQTIFPFHPELNEAMA